MGTTSAKSTYMTWLRFMAALVLVVGCSVQDQEQANEGPDAPPAPAMACAVDSDCELAGSSCCECPSFALPVSGGFGEACGDLDCQVPESCPAIQAVCSAGACVLECLPLACDLTCGGGFAMDELGCLVCACTASGPITAECQDDVQCAQVPADCCGCSRGGEDTAVPMDQVEAHRAGLDCPAEPACPGVNACMEGYGPKCVNGHCELAPAMPEDNQGSLGWCGRSDLPACADGQVCVLNDPEAKEATQAGVGVCRGG